MSLDELIAAVESRVFDLGKRLLDERPPVRKKDAAEAIREQLRQHYTALHQHGAAMEQVRGRISAGEVDAALCASRVETALYIGDLLAAWGNALALDRTRRTLEADRAQLREHESACREQRTHVERLESRLALVLDRTSPARPQAPRPRQWCR